MNLEIECGSAGRPAIDVNGLSTAKLTAMSPYTQVRKDMSKV